LWCNQLVKTLANALLELSDLQDAHPGPVPVDERMRLFGRYFIRLDLLLLLLLLFFFFDVRSGSAG
jgi:hypothetical protein